MNLNQINLNIVLEVGRTTATISQVEKLGEGDIIQLDTMMGDKLAIRANGVLIAKGEVVLSDGNYAVKITEIVSGGDND